MAYNEFKLSGDTKGDWGTYDHPPLLVSVGWPLRDCRRKAGLYPVDSETLVLIASDSFDSKLSQAFCPFSTYWAIIVLTVRFARSFEFSRGQYGAVNWCSTPVSLTVNRYRTPVSSGLRSGWWSVRGKLVSESLERGSGSTKSAHSLPKGSLTCLFSIFPACLRCSELNFWHEIHWRTYRRTSRNIPGQ